MKYIKTYENLDERGFWYIPYDNEEYILMCIKRLPIPEKIIDKIYGHFCRFFLNPDSLDRVKYGICFSYNPYKISKWSFWPCSKELNFEKAMKFYKEEGSEYKGEIKLEDWEVSAKKYNL